MPHRYLLSLLAISALLSSCANFDFDYPKLEAAAETQPKPHAVVGMWHRKATDGWGLHLRQSILFNRDGTGMDSYYHTDWLIGESDQTKKFTWSYEGSGVWKTQYTPGKDSGWTWRMSQGKLIRKGGLGIQEVLERVDP